MTETHTIESTAKRLAEFAQLTANNSKNWKAFEVIVRATLQSAYNAGKEAK